MWARRLRFSSGLSSSLTTLAMLLAAAGAPHAQAGMFDDDEARRQIKDLSIQTSERIDTLSKAQFELANQIQAVREENAKLRGQVETLNYELESTKKRQQDFYIDLDGRLRKFEPQSASTPDSRPEDEGSKSAPEAPKKAADPAAESHDYDTALNFFQGNKIKEAAGAFASFGKKYPESTMAPNAQYWLGIAFSVLHDCKKSVDALKLVVSKWPQHPKAPESLINIASCQQELGDSKAAKATLETVLVKYPASPAAATAKQRLKK
ncbi:MAG: tol-pal system protein YbgF [Betaproteobacteria bacterium]